jgi:hypothetical protein
MNLLLGGIIMVRKKQITKLDVIRWIAVLPVVIIVIGIYSIFFLDILYKLLPKFFNEELVANLVGFVNAVTLPALIVMSGYIVPSKFKFRTSLILTLFFLLLQALHITFNDYDKSNPFIPVFALSYLISLGVIYKIDGDRYL